MYHLESGLISLTDFVSITLFSVCSLLTMTTSTTWRLTTLLTSVKNGNHRLRTNFQCHCFASSPLFAKSPLDVTIVHFICSYLPSIPVCDWSFTQWRELIKIFCFPRIRVAVRHSFIKSDPKFITARIDINVKVVTFLPCWSFGSCGANLAFC